MDSITVNRNEYGHKKGDRFDRHVPKDSELLSREGTFQGQSVTSEEFKPKKGERNQLIMPEQSDIWKVELIKLIFQHQRFLERGNDGR